MMVVLYQVALRDATLAFVVQSGSNDSFARCTFSFPLVRYSRQLRDGKIEPLEYIPGEFVFD
jgi:hypothetical protein